MSMIYYITNMFPGKHDNYGIFCKKTFDFFNNSKEFTITRMSAIRGKSFHKFWNIFRYCKLLFSIAFTLLFKNNTFDIVYIQYVWKHAFFVTYFIKKLNRKKKIMFLNFHGEDLTDYDSLSSKEKEQFRQLCMFASGIVVPSIYFQNLLCSTLSLDLTKKIIVTPSGGVDSGLFFKQNNGINNKIVYCSRFDKDKGWDDFILAAKELVSVNNSLHFLMIGYGKETSEVQKMIQELKLNNKIEVIINPTQGKIAESYSDASLFVFPTRRLSESLGLVALEAMSCGLPVIASNIGAISEYVRENENGFLYQPGNVKELIEKMMLFFSKDSNIQLCMQKKAYETAENYRDKKVKVDFINQIIKFCNK